ncbi:MAG: hypothetical protein DI629_14795 [Mesorhizobium amorphae]|nr:MAG: hypothetical protein DI629_14795 [Mesorhizobium amorphae]
MNETAPRTRFPLVDLARGAALIAMAIYHFTWDLEFFGYLAAGTTAQGGWKIFARCIASSFLFLVGVSLVLAHLRGIRWAPFLRRMAMVAGAALAITAITYAAVPDEFIFFGILHQIALASLLGLLFLRLPAPLTALAGAGVIALPFLFRSEAFAHPLLWWIGLAPVPPRSNDFVPVFPFFGAVLLGLSFAKSQAVRGWLATAVSATPNALKPLAFIGRHSLAFYLVHQPILIALVWLGAQIVPPAIESPQVRFMPACQQSCAAIRDADFCARYCSCMLDEIDAQGMMDDVFGTPDETAQTRIDDLASQCTARSDLLAPAEPLP